MHEIARRMHACICLPGACITAGRPGAVCGCAISRLARLDAAIAVNLKELGY